MASSFSSPWPDPNSPVLSKIDFGVPLVELFKWLDVRYTLLGDNFKEQDITAALALARDCQHSDAVWLTSIFEGKNVSTKENVRKVFLLKMVLVLFALHGGWLMIAGTICHCFVVPLKWETLMLVQRCVWRSLRKRRGSFSLGSTCG